MFDQLIDRIMEVRTWEVRELKAVITSCVKEAARIAVSRYRHMQDKAETDNYKQLLREIGIR